VPLALGDKFVAVENLYQAVVDRDHGEGRAERRRTAQRHDGRSFDVRGYHAAAVPAVAAVGRSAEAPVDQDLDRHLRDSSFFTSAAPASADSWSSA
jgi:hypothetical protein